MRWTLERLLVTGKYQLISDVGEIRNFLPDELHARWLKGELVIDETCLGSLANATYFATPRDLSTYTDKQQKVALRKQSYLRAVDPEKNPYNPQQWKKLIDEHATQIADPAPPCSSSVQNWWRIYRNTKTVHALIPQKKGRAKPYHGDRYAIFEEAVADVYLTLQKQPKSAVYERVLRHITSLNSSLPPDLHIRCPARSTVYRWLDGLRQDIVDGARLGAEVARAKYRIAIGGLKVNGILERIEIDHTPIDLIVVDAATGLQMGRPWLSIATDKASRMIMGFYLSFNTPSAHSVLQCLRRAILPKTEWLIRFPDIKGTWPAQGIPDLIAIDNGMDLHASGLQKACEEMGVQMLFCGARTPEHKGSIERFFRTMNQGLIHRLPGTTFSNVGERGDYPAEKLAAITLTDLVHLITKWVVDIYLVRPHRAIGATPLAKWSELARQRSIELPLYPKQLEVISGIPAKRTLFHYGIELEGQHYNSRQLQELRRQSGKNMVVDLKFYEHSISFIQVFNPLAKEYLEVPCVDPTYANDLPREVHRLIRERAKQQFGDNASSIQMLEVRAELEKIIERAIKNKKMAVRKNAGGLLMHDSEAVLDDKDSLAKARRPLKKLEHELPESLPAGLDDVLPTLAVFERGAQSGAN